MPGVVSGVSRCSVPVGVRVGGRRGGVASSPLIRASVPSPSRPPAAAFCAAVTGCVLFLFLLVCRMRVCCAGVVVVVGG